MSDDEKKKDRSWLRPYLAGVALLGCILSLFLVNTIGQQAIGAAPQAVLAQEQPTRRPTRTPAPTYQPPTPDYIATNVHLQGVADAARADALQARALAVSAQETAVQSGVEAAAIQRDIAQITLEAEQLQVSSTQVAAIITQTAYPMVATADALRIADAQQQRAYTAAEPLRVQALADAQAQAQYADDKMRADTWIRLGIGTFLFALAALCMANIILRIWRAATPAPVQAEPRFIEPEEEVTRVAIQTGAPGYTASDYHDIPCSPEQMSELARGLLHEHKTLAINVWEGSGTLFNRRVFTNVLGWMLRVGLATRDASQTAALTAEGESFLLAWEERQQLPHPYKFSPDHAHSTRNPNHDHDSLMPNPRGGGEGD